MRLPLLGITIGTCSSEAALVRPDGEIVETAGVPHPMEVPHPERA